MDATLYTDVWGSYFHQILSDGWIRQMAHNCGCAFDERVLMVNDIPERILSEFDSLLSKRIKDRSVDRALMTDKLANAELARYGLRPPDFTSHPYASMADLVAISDCKSEYIVYFAGDCVPWGSSNWVSDGIKILRDRQDTLIVNPTWNGFYEHSKVENIEEREEYFLGHGFSDGCYLARTADLKADIYHETNPESDRIYCAAHGNTFEKRVNAYMRNHNKYRVTLKNACYITRP